MQEEVKKYTKKIYYTMKNPKHSFNEKVKEVSIEIFTIVFAVTLSIWLHSWSEHRHQQEEVSVFLDNLKDDIKNIDIEKKAYQTTNVSYEKKLALTAPQIDSI